MKKVWDFLNTTLGLGLLMLLVLVLVALFGGRNVVGLAGQPLATVAPVVEVTPTSIPRAESGFRAENIEIAKEVQLTTEGRNSFSSWISWSPLSTSVLVNRFNGRTIKDQNVTYLLTDIWKITVDGNDFQKLAADAFGARWSEDGKMILYLSTPDADTQDVYVMNEDGSNQTKVASGERGEVYWLPHRRIAYPRENRIWVADTTGKSAILAEKIELIHSPKARRYNPYFPSPDGDKIAFIDKGRLLIVKLDGTQVKITDDLTDYSRADLSVSWSPSGEKLTYITGGNQPKLWIVNAEGSDPTMLVSGEMEFFEHPRWFPDGKAILFSRFPTGTEKYFSIYVVNDDGSGLKDLTGDRGTQEFPELSPDGRKVAFFREGNLYIAFLSLNE